MAENFWQGETCEYCGGEIVEKHVTMHRTVKSKLCSVGKRAGRCMYSMRHALLFS